MATFDVFVEGPIGGGPEALDKLAQLMAKRYGLPAVELVARMSKGRFRVKGNIDEATANKYARDLESIGARVSIAASRQSSARQTDGISLKTPPAGVPIAADASPARPATPSSAPPSVSPNTIARPATPRLATPQRGTPVSGTPRPATPQRGTPVSGTPRPATPATGTPLPATSLPARSGEPFARPSPLPPRPTPPPAKPDEPLLPSGFTAMDLPKPTAGRNRIATPPTGLAAAFSTEAPAATGLGALESATLDGDSLALAALDGSEGDARPQISFAPPKPGADKAAKPKPERPKDVPVDLFEPPEAAAANFEIDLATDELEARQKKQPPAPAPPPAHGPALELEAGSRAAGASQPLKRPDARPRIPSPPAGVAVAAVASETPRWRFAAGVVVAVVLGFVPAHCVASVREDSADAKIDDAVVLMQEQATTPDSYDKLDEFRDDQLAKKRSAHRSIALASMLIWAVAGAALGFGWFKVVPWDRLRTRDQSSS